MRKWNSQNYRRLPGCVVMGINRTRRLFGRQKKDAWAASQYTLYGFRPRCYHFLSPLFLFFSLWWRKLHFRYAHGYFLDIYNTLEQSKELSRRGFWLDDRCLKGRSVLLYCSILSLLLKKFYALLPQLKTRNLRESLFQPFLEESRNVDK